MISANGVSLQFGKEPLFKDVNISFLDGNCYGLIGANGAGKSTFMKILSGDIPYSAGSVDIPKGQRLSMLRQDHFAFEEEEVLMTVVMGHRKIYDLMVAKDALYAKNPFTEADGMKSAELEEEFCELDGWSIESEAAKLLNELGITEEFHSLKMKQLESSQKVRVLLAQALVGTPDVLLLDEPTNHLDMETAMWLEEFLINFENTAIVVSHDRHFLDKVCTHIADIDFQKIQLFPGNYTFWSESSQLALKQRQDKNKKTEVQRKELKDFIARFSSNASKAKQATSRKKSLEKLALDEIKPSTRKYPFIDFTYEKEAGNEILNVTDLTTDVDGERMFTDFNLQVNKGDRIAFIGRNTLSKSTLFQCIMQEATADAGVIKMGATVNVGYFPKDFGPYFQNEMTILEWLRQYKQEEDENFFRSFLGKMFFSGEDVFKKVSVLSGGEKVRCMFSRLMMLEANVLILDEPTNHLDLESITSLNTALAKFKGTLLLSSHDHTIIQSVANRIVEITPKGFLDKPNYSLDEYYANDTITAQRKQLY